MSFVSTRRIHQIVIFLNKMCGIFFHCSNKSKDDTCIDSKLVEFLGRRGPDALRQINCFQFDYRFKFIGNVLHLRGDLLVKQPINKELSLNVLLWNGEMFNCDTGNRDLSDSQFLYNQLENCNDDESLILQVISKVQGPFAFIYYNEVCKCLFFGRDVIGRRSLCLKKVDEPFELNISSVCCPEDSGWEEIPATGIYCYNFSTDKPKFKLIKWERDVAGIFKADDRIESIPSPINTPLNYQLPETDYIQPFDENDETVNAFISILSKSIKTRVTKFNQLCHQCVNNFAKNCDHSSIGILFSGGLDSSVLALLSDDYIPKSQSIDLINVAFKPDAPDRLTGLEAYEEIKTLRPERRWNFIKIDVPLEDLTYARQSRIRHLIRPADTVLDDSVACAVWFAAKGHGICGSDEYHSPARIVLLGMGADEQLGGYSRYRNAFQRNGWKQLIDEVRIDLARIWIRNLGRDDRIISDHGRESRLPYLDENLINFLNSLPIWKKTNLKLERGKGEKILLRLVALKLGLIKVSGFPKRAIQFGCRIAHLEKRGEKGSDQCPRLFDQQN